MKVTDIQSGIKVYHVCHHTILTRNFPVSVVKISILKIHSYNVWHENGWILFWKFKIKSVMAGFCSEIQN